VTCTSNLAETEDIAEPNGVTLRRERGRAMLRMWGEHDLFTVDLLRSALIEAIDTCEAGVVIDLGDVTFMGSATLKTLSDTRAVLAERGRSLTFRSPPRGQRRMLQICGLADLIEPETVGGPSFELGPALVAALAPPPPRRAGEHPHP
jgi:anti-sigma B factor antagonist